MTTDLNRPDPDQLLGYVQAEEIRRGRGKLKIFLGYVAGVGKTYAMLQAAHQRREEGVDLVIGYVETHGRAEIDALVAGLETVPRRQGTYRDVTLTEMDIDAVLARRPQLVLVDELAHTNAPGSRHPKRYQDVEEILDAGIDVYTTLNIQHLESLNDIVAQITGTLVRETVPDRVLHRAGEIEVIDLPIEELRRRLAEGKVYVPAQAEEAARRFFRPGNLTALRELAFRQAAARVDEDMRAYMQTHAIAGPWPAGERLLVCVSPSPLSERLVRTGSRLARNLNAEWVAAYVETADSGLLTNTDRQRVAHTLGLAESLGASVVTLPGQTVADAIAVYAQRHNITKIVAGKPVLPRWRDWLRGSLVDQILRRVHGIDVYVIGSDEEAVKPVERSTQSTPWTHYLQGVLLVTLVTLLALPIRALIEPTNLVMLYLLAVMVAAVRWERSVAVVVSLLGVLAFDVIFVPPYYTLAVSDAEYVLTFAGLLLVGLVISGLAAQAREQAQAALRRENQTIALYEFSRGLASAITVGEIAQMVTEHVTRNLGGDATLWIPQGETVIAWQDESVNTTETRQATAGEHGVAQWVYRHGKPAGSGTDTLPASERLHLPLLQGDTTLGVLSVRLDSSVSPDREQQRLLTSFANQTALALDRVQLAEKARQAQVLRETERLQSALLNSISHDLRTPLASITGSLSSLKDDSAFLDDVAKTYLVETALGEAERLNYLVNNLLDMSRLESGAVHLKLEPCDVEDLIGVVLEQMGSRLRHHAVTINLAPDLPLVPLDFVLVAQVLVNLLDNAAKYSPEGTEIELYAIKKEAMVEIGVADRGSGIPADSLAQVFNKFYRVETGDRSVGTGLGLTIAKAVVDAHRGEIMLRNRADGGTLAQIRFRLNTTNEGASAHGE